MHSSIQTVFNHLDFDDYRHPCNSHLIPPVAQAYLGRALRMKPFFVFKVNLLSSYFKWGTCKAIRRALKILIELGYCRAERRHGAGGLFEQGLYQFTDVPGRFDCDPIVDENGTEPAFFRPMQPHDDNGHVEIDRSSISKPVTAERANVDKSGDDALKGEAERREGAAKACLPEEGKAERRRGAAKACLPEVDRRQGAARGSAMMQEAAKSPQNSDAIPGGVRFAEQCRQHLIRILDLKVAAGSLRQGLRNTGEILSWMAGGADWEKDILATVCHKAPGLRDGAIFSWSYFRQAVFEARDRRQRRVKPSSASDLMPSRRMADSTVSAGGAGDSILRRMKIDPRQ